MITEVDVGFIYIIIGVHVKTANCCDSLAVCVCVFFFVCAILKVVFAALP